MSNWTMHFSYRIDEHPPIGMAGGVLAAYLIRPRMRCVAVSSPLRLVPLVRYALIPLLHTRDGWLVVIAAMHCMHSGRLFMVSYVSPISTHGAISPRSQLNDMVWMGHCVIQPAS